MEPARAAELLSLGLVVVVLVLVDRHPFLLARVRPPRLRRAYASGAARNAQARARHVALRAARRHPCNGARTVWRPRRAGAVVAAVARRRRAEIGRAAALAPPLLSLSTTQTHRRRTHPDPMSPHAPLHRRRRTRRRLPALAAAQAFAPGEETVLQVRYLSLPTGEGRITVGQPEGDVWPVIFQARTQGVAALIDIREHLVSYWDRPRGSSRGFDLRAYEVGDFHADSARFDRANGTATFERQRNGSRTSKTFAVPADVHDLTSALMWLRLQPLEPGQRYEVPVCRGRSSSARRRGARARAGRRPPPGRSPR